MTSASHHPEAVDRRSGECLTSDHIEIQRGEVNALGDGHVFVMRSTADSLTLGINVVDEEQPALELRAGDHFQVGATEWKVVEVVDLSPFPDYCPPGWLSGTVAARVEQVSFRPRAEAAPGWTV